MEPSRRPRGQPQGAPFPSWAWAAGAALGAALAPGCGHEPADPPSSRADDVCRGLFAPPGREIDLVPAYPDLPPFTVPGRVRPLSPMALRRDPTQPDGGWVAALRQGVLVRFRDAVDVDAYDTLLDIRDRVGFAFDDGLVSLALSPDFASSGRVYLMYVTAEPRQVRVSSFAPAPGGLGGDPLDPSAERVLFEEPKIPEVNSHSGGSLRFGPDGMLYGSIGDGGFTRPPADNAQDRSNLLGTVFRIDVAGASDAAPYRIPDDNPFPSGESRPEIWAWGFRNPFRFSFDQVTGALWLGDVGHISWEEVNVVQRRGDYGWPILEGDDCYPVGEVEDCPRDDRTGPVHRYHLDAGAAIVGGAVYRGRAIPSLRGAYVFADFADAGLRVLRDPYGSEPRAERIATLPYGPVGFAQDDDGEIVVFGLGPGEWHRVEPARGDPGGVPARLADTGCMDPETPTQLAAGFTPYDVRVPLWSDGADKTRALAMPPEGTIRLEDDGDLTFPLGSVLSKDFVLAGRRLETRFLVHRAEGRWSGYSYRWDAEGSEATLVTEPTLVDVGDGQSWLFPSPDQCGRCHTAAAGFTLGPESRQLAATHDRDDPLLEDWASAGWLESGAGSGALSRLWPRWDDLEAPLGVRARAYLHVNCAGCHRPGHPLRAVLDLRLDTPLAATGVCAPPRIDDLGLPDARIVAPGNPDRSVLLARMGSRGSEAMPPLATTLPDARAVELVTSWIVALPGCGDPR